MSLTVRLAVAALAIGLGLGAAPSAEATVVRALSLQQKAELAPVIVHAVVRSISVERDPDATRVVTLIQVEVLEAIKGDVKAGQILTLWQAGGRSGDLHSYVPGQSVYERGEQAILFLERAPNGHLVEIGVGIGKYGIEQTPSGPMVTHHPKVGLAITEPGKPMRIEEGTAMEPVALDRFLTQVRTYAKGKKPIEVKSPRPAPAR